MSLFRHDRHSKFAILPFCVLWASTCVQSPIHKSRSAGHAGNTMSATLMVYLRPSSLTCCLYSSPSGPMYAFPHLGGLKPTPRDAVFGRARYCRLVNRDRIGNSSCQGGLGEIS